jgi:hypothetical protein
VSDEIPKVEKIEPQSVRGPLFTLLLAGAVGVVLIQLAEARVPALIDWLARDWPEDASRLRTGFFILAAAICLPDMGMAVYLWRLGERAIREERFPPAGTKLLRDKPLVRGAAAQQRGRILKTAGVVLAVTGVVLFALLLRFAALLER